MSIVAILFNPIIPLRFPKEFWMAVDMGAAIFFGLHLIVTTNIGGQPDTSGGGLPKMNTATRDYMRRFRKTD